MEKVKPLELDKYLLGSYDDTLEAVETILLYIMEEDFSYLDTVSDERVKLMLFKRAIMNINTERNLKQDVDIFLGITEKIKPVGCDREIKELFIDRKYGVFSQFNKGSLEIGEYAVKQLRDRGIVLSNN